MGTWNGGIGRDLSVPVSCSRRRSKKATGDGFEKLDKTDQGEMIDLPVVSPLVSLTRQVKSLFYEPVLYLPIQPILPGYILWTWPSSEQWEA